MKLGKGRRPVNPYIAKQRKSQSKATASHAQPRQFRRDYLAIANDYAARAASEKNAHQFGKWIRLAAQRYHNDLKRASLPNNEFYFDEYHACDVCDFIEGLPHVEGTWDTDNIVLHESDVFFLTNLFGFRKQDGTRRFTSALKAVARKNAKSTIAAAIGLYCQNCEGELGPQVLSAATTGSQARIIFNIAKRMVEQTFELRKKYELDPYTNFIAALKCGGVFKPINAKASTQDGLNPSCTLFDEIHAHKTHDLVNVLRSAAGARKNPLMLFTTTEGYEWPGPWPELRHFARQVLEGLVEADHFFAAIYAIDDKVGEPGQPGYLPGDDDFDEAAWHKANPLMDVNPLLLQELRKEAAEARSMPGRLAEFRIKRLNRQSASAGAWVNLVKWKQCSAKVDLHELKQYRCWGGLDLASVRDLSSFRLVWFVNGHWYTHGWRFVPRVAIYERTESALVPYRAWADANLLLEAGDETTDYDYIEETILTAKKTFNLQSIAFDPWNASQLIKNLQKRVTSPPDQPFMVEFIQGPKSFHPAMKELERAYVSGKLSHGGDPVLNWCMANLVARTDVNMNLAPDKKRSPDKIDDAVAMLMAMGLALKQNTPSVESAGKVFFV